MWLNVDSHSLGQLALASKRTASYLKNGMETAEVDQFDSSSCQTILNFISCWLLVPSF